MRDWVMKELEAMGWEPGNGRIYDRRMNVPQLMRELFLEAATRPEFAEHRRILLDCAVRRDEYTLLIASRWPHVAHTGGMWFENVNVAPNIREVSEAGVVRSYQVGVSRGGVRVVRNLPTLEQAISYRDRVIAAHERGKDLNSVPLYSDH
ncbi:MAG: hypothetical protein ACO3GW_02855 [Vulcanococcus sp.]